MKQKYTYLELERLREVLSVIPNLWNYFLSAFNLTPYCRRIYGGVRQTTTPSMNDTLLVPINQVHF